MNDQNDARAGIPQMGKLTDKRIELARRVLDTVDARKLALVEEALDGSAEQAFTPAQIKEFKAIRDRIRSGSVPTWSLQEVKRRAKKHVAA